MKTMQFQTWDNVEFYKELKDLFLDQDPDFLASLTEDEMISLEHVLDFENYSFMVINFARVVTVADGTIVSFDDLESFKEQTKEFINEV